MGKNWKVVVCGQTAVGKTALLEQLIHGEHMIGQPMFSTIEDIYVGQIETDRGMERVHFYDTAGLDPMKPELPKQYLSFADGFVLVYDVTNERSFQSMDKLKKSIEKHREKKEAVIISLGNKCDIKDGKQVDFNAANKWAQGEKVRLWEVSVSNRQSLVDPIVWLTTKITVPPNRPTFPAFGASRRQKASSNSELL